MSLEKPNCYECKHRGTIPGNAHSTCNNSRADVKGDQYGRDSGWFYWPGNFDPVWLISCDGFEEKEKITNDSPTDGH